jgi:N-acetylglucosamine-6-phosphate deacetylase
MESQQIITNAALIGYVGLQEILISDRGIIKQINSVEKSKKKQKTDTLIDVQGDWLSLGGVDLQINGGLGLAFTDLELKDLETLDKICAFLWQQGIDGFLPTIVTTALKKIERSLEVINEFIGKQKDKQRVAKILGVHLEGPFLNYAKRGAHPAKYLLPLTIDNAQKILDKFLHITKIITLAPELDETGKVIEYLYSQKITVSLGHSLATAEQAKKAFKQGASMVTHAFNAMPSLHHREPGLLGEAIINHDVYCGLIADGNHVCPTMIKILLQASNYERGIFLVSDALAPIGLANGIYPWDTREIEITKGTARLKDGTLAGTTLPLLVGVKNLVKWKMCSVEQAIAMATESPRKAIGLSGIKVGQLANLLRWHWDEDKENLTWKRLDLY